jgi:hypothetical protein
MAPDPHWKLFGLFKAIGESDGWAPTPYLDENDDAMWVFKEGDRLIKFTDVSSYSNFLN